MLKRIIIILIILSSLKFYSFAFLPELVIKVSEWLGIGLILAFTIVYFVYNREITIKKHFSFPIILIFTSVLLSMLGSYMFQDQSFALTAYAQRAIYLYLLYFLLHLMKLDGDFIIKTIVTLALVYLVIYFIQYILYPIQITTTKMFIDRGTLRIFLSGAGYLVISYFIWLYMAFRNFRLKYAIFLFSALGIFVLMGTRQVLASMLLLTMLFIFQSRVVKSKFLLITLIGISLIPVYFIFQNIILSMFEVTQAQSQNLEGSIRYEAARFFLTKFYPNKLAYVTGHGAAGPSIYGLRLARYAEEFGYYLADIGLIGEYIKYGMIYVIGVFIILFKILTSHLPEKLMFIKYNFFGIILTLVTGGGAFASGSNIIIICLLLYLIDIYMSDKHAFDSTLTGSTVKHQNVQLIHEKNIHIT